MAARDPEPADEMKPTYEVELPADMDLPDPDPDEKPMTSDDPEFLAKRPVLPSADAWSGGDGLLSAESEPKPSEDPAKSGVVCPRCGYNLFGLPAGSDCPECGLKNAASPQSRPRGLWAGDPVWLRGLQLGAALLVASVASWTLALVMWVVLDRFATPTATALTLRIWCLSALAIGAMGALLLSSPGPVDPQEQGRSVPRLWLRALWVAALAIASTPLWLPSPAASIAFVTAAGLAFAATVATLFWSAWLARLLDAKPLAETLRTLGMMWCAMVLGCVVYGGLMIAMPGWVGGASLGVACGLSLLLGMLKLGTVINLAHLHAELGRAVKRAKG